MMMMSGSEEKRVEQERSDKQAHLQLSHKPEACRLKPACGLLSCLNLAVFSC